MMMMMTVVQSVIGLVAIAYAVALALAGSSWVPCASWPQTWNS